MPFGNPAVGGIELVRNSIQSPGFVAGSSGWSIKRDGTAEFDNVQIRGTIAATAANANAVNGQVRSTDMNASSPNYDSGLTSNNPAGWSIDNTGNAVFNNITARGMASGPNASFDNIVANTSLKYKGDELQSLLDAKPRGLVASGALQSAASGSGITTEIGIGEIDFIQVANRDYKVTFDGINWSCQTALCTAQFNLRYTADGTAPTISSPLLECVIQPAVNLNQALTSPPMMTMGTYSATDGQIIRVLLTIQRLAGTGTLSWNTYAGTANFHSIRLYVEDVGLDIGPDTFITNTGGGTLPASKTTYTKYYYSTGVQSYDVNGNKSIATNNNVYGYQGDGTAVGNPGGNSASIFLFNSAAIRSDLSGATILHTYLYTKNVHSYLNSGATARIGTHNADAIPATIGAVGINQRRWDQTTPEGGSVWSNDAGTALGTEFQNGTTHGLMLGYSSPASLNDYSYWSQLGVKIVYQK